MGAGPIGAWLNMEVEGQTVRARIVETQACGGMEDAASNANGPGGQGALEQDAGRLLLQFACGMYTVSYGVAHQPGGLGAVLLRAVDARQRISSP